jgi:hypothetical protein
MNKAEFIISITIALLLTPMLMEVNAIAQPEPAAKSMQIRAQAWFDSEEIKARRKQMRQMTRALKQPCKYCHTAGFKGYTDRHSISLEMMVMSAEHDVQCDECHIRKEALTPLGVQSAKMIKIGQQLQVECNHCHVKQRKFKILTPHGETYRAEIKSTQSPMNRKPSEIDRDAEATPPPNQDEQPNPVDQTERARKP